MCLSSVCPNIYVKGGQVRQPKMKYTYEQMDMEGRARGHARPYIKNSEQSSNEIKISYHCVVNNMAFYTVANSSAVNVSRYDDGFSVKGNNQMQRN